MRGIEIVLNCAAIWALATILFRSYPGLWLAGWSAHRRKLADGERSVLSWELTNGLSYDPEYASAHPRHRAQMQPPPELTSVQIQERRERLRKLMEKTLPFRLLGYFLGCPTCQHFWAALIILGPWQPTYLLACIGLTTLGSGVLLRAMGETTAKPTGGKPGGCPGGNCGG